MEKFSVIIPTIWKSEFTIPLLQRLSKSEAVGEIILIDNAPNWDITMDKLIHIKESENTYVNPAWNKGVELAKWNNITIANDDILFDVDEYFHYMEQIPLKEFGFIGSHSDNYKDGEFDTIHLEKYDNQTNVGGWGCLFSFDKRLPGLAQSTFEFSDGELGLSLPDSPASGARKVLWSAQ